MSKFTPFADDAAATSIGKLTIENGTDWIALHGSLDLTRDRQGLAQARALKAILDQAVRSSRRRGTYPTRCSPLRRSRPSPTRSIEILAMGC